MREAHILVARGADVPDDVARERSETQRHLVTLQTDRAQFGDRAVPFKGSAAFLREMRL